MMVNNYSKFKKEKEMTKCVVTHTDLFGGEANYGWVNRYEFIPKRDASQRSIVKKAKELAGFTGVKSETEDYGDSFKIKPRGYNQVIFVDFE
jgi:hypothetical protein